MLAAAAHRCARHGNADVPRGRRDGAARRGGGLRRRAVRAGARVRPRPDGRARADASRAASGRTRGGVGRRLGDGELALRDPERMDRVLRARDAHLTHPSLPRTLAARLRAAGFAQVGAEGHVFATTALDPEAFGTGVLLKLVEEYVAGRPEVGPEEARRGRPSSASWAHAASCSSRAPSSASPRSASASPRARRSPGGGLGRRVEPGLEEGAQVLAGDPLRQVDELLGRARCRGRARRSSCAGCGRTASSPIFSRSAWSVIPPRR